MATTKCLEIRDASASAELNPTVSMVRHRTATMLATTIVLRSLDSSTCQPVKNWRILLEQSFTAHMPLLTATIAFRLGRTMALPTPSQYCMARCHVQLN